MDERQDDAGYEAAQRAIWLRAFPGDDADDWAYVQSTTEDGLTVLVLCRDDVPDPLAAFEAAVLAAREALAQ